MKTDDIIFFVGVLVIVVVGAFLFWRAWMQQRRMFWRWEQENEGKIVDDDASYEGKKR